MFKEKYEKFRKTITDFDVIPKESKKIIIGMSGGKDSAVMAHFLLEYQKRERPDIALELWTSPVPFARWDSIPDELFNTPLDKRQKELIAEHKTNMDNFYAYWEKLFAWETIPAQQELFKGRMLNMNWGCILCFCARMKSFSDYLTEQPGNDDTLFAFGWTKWDAHYTLLSHFMKSSGLKWYEEKKQNPQKYKADCIFLASFLAYPRVNMGIPNKNVYRINPMLEFDDIETNALAQEMEIPILPEICKELYGEKFDQDRRYLSTYLRLFSGNQKLLKASDSAFMYSYRSLMNHLTITEILPPVEELHGLMYDAYNSNFDDLYDLLKL